MRATLALRCALLVIVVVALLAVQRGDEAARAGDDLGALYGREVVTYEPGRATGQAEVLSGQLREALSSIREGDAPGEGVEAIGGLVRVEVLHTGDAAAIKATITGAGGVLEGEAEGLVQALVPAATLGALERRADVTFVRPPVLVSEPLFRPGESAAETAESLLGFADVLGQEVAKTNAAAWQTAGYTGAGVKIGIVDIFDAVPWNASQAAGEVPVPAGAFCRNNGAVCDPFNIGAGASGAHGTAVAEIVHEMAPDAEIYVGTAITTADLQAVENLFDTAGVHIITRSLTSQYDGQGNGTGPIASVINNAVSDGIVWVNAAGNASAVEPDFGAYWRGGWADANSNMFLDFAPGDELLGFACNFPNGLRWSDWGSTKTDYDVYVFDNPGDPMPFAASVDDQTAGAPALELNIPCTGEVDYLAIHRFAIGNGTSGDVLELLFNSAVAEYWQNPFAASSPASDTANAGALAVGAIDPPMGTSIAPYSSWGPTNDMRRKPDVSAAACVDSMAFAPDCFDGTSAATPAVAGAVALLLDAGVVTTPASAKLYLLNVAARDGGAPAGDNVYGRGEIVLPPPDDFDDDGCSNSDEAASGINPLNAKDFPDFNGNAFVDFPDFLFFVMAYNSLPSSPNWNGLADLDDNEFVAFPDFLSFVNAWTRLCVSAG